MEQNIHRLSDYLRREKPLRTGRWKAASSKQKYLTQSMIHRKRDVPLSKVIFQISVAD